MRTGSGLFVSGAALARWYFGNFAAGDLAGACNKLPNPTTIPRSRITTPEEANAEVASKSSGSCSSSDGGNIDCNTLLARSICVRMLVLLVPSVNVGLL